VPDAYHTRRLRHTGHCHDDGVACNNKKGPSVLIPLSIRRGAMMRLHYEVTKARLVDGRASDQDGPSGVCGPRRAQDGYSDALAAAVAVCGGVKCAAAPGGGQRLRCESISASEGAGLSLLACNVRPCVAHTIWCHCMLPTHDRL